MRMMIKMLAGAAGLAAMATAAPAAAQYYPYGYNYNPYGYSSYGSYGVGANVAQQQCTAAVQNRLANRTSLARILHRDVPCDTSRSIRRVSSGT